MSRAIGWMLAVGVCALAASCLSCGSPVHDQQVAEMGPEPPGEHPGPLHRAGQPCLVCHGWLGPSHTEFAVAGTVYKAINDKTGVDGAIVIFTTPDQNSIAVQTNAVGNFYVVKDRWPLSFPYQVQVQYPKLPNNMKMASPISRDGACNDCHADPAGPARFGHIYLVADVADFPQ